MMRKQTNNNIAAGNSTQFKAGIKSISPKKNPRYIYTEEDLGEGILDAGISDATDQQDNLITKPWTTMLKTKWS